MDAPARVVHPLLVIALVIAAVCGYVLGTHRPAANAGSQGVVGSARVANAAGLVLEYPAGWEHSSTPKSIPGLTLTEAVTLAPHGDSESGLLTGMLPGGEPAPLPAGFLARLGGAPHAEVVSLVSTQAYRYSGLSLPGYRGVFDLYAIPAASGTGMRVMACFAPQRLTAAGEECERIVANVTLTGTAAVALTPSAAYAGGLGPAIRSLDAARAKERSELGQSSSAVSVAAPARTLASRYLHASRVVAALESPAVAAVAQGTLSRSLIAASQAYGELASAAEAEAAGSYDAARGRIASAESGVDSALENLALLGYGAA